MSVRKKFLLTIAVTIAFIIGGELLARYYLGLGTPPLSISHPRIEYMYKPNQDVYRFGNRFIVNQWGMRSNPFPVKKDNEEYRVIIFGDSVINGGNLTDHYSLATTILEDKLEKNRNKNVTVGNISAGSWGPGNWLAYAQEYGFFNADTIVLVISSHDLVDNPTFKPLNEKTHPTQKPILALFEGVTRYLPRYLPSGDSQTVNQNNNETFSFPIVKEKVSPQGLEDLRAFLKLAKSTTNNVYVFQHWEKGEIEKGKADQGNQTIQEVCEQMQIPTISLEPFLRNSIQAGLDPYRDNIHPNSVGQQVIAEALYENIPHQKQ